MDRCVRITVLLLLVVADGQSQTHANEPVAKWREDLEFARRELPRVHKNLFHTISREEFDRSLSSLSERLPALDDDQIIVELGRIVAKSRDAPRERGECTALQRRREAHRSCGAEIGFDRRDVLLVLVRVEVRAPTADAELLVHGMQDSADVTSSDAPHSLNQLSATPSRLKSVSTETPSARAIFSASRTDGTILPASIALIDRRVTPAIDARSACVRSRIAR